MRQLLATLRKEVGQVPTSSLLHTVLVDMENVDYRGGLDVDGIRAQGVEVCHVPMVTHEQRHDADKTARAIMYMALHKGKPYACPL